MINLPIKGTNQLGPMMNNNCPTSLITGFATAATV